MICYNKHERIYLRVRAANYAADIAAVVAALIAGFARNAFDGYIQLYSPFLFIFTTFFFFSRVRMARERQDERILRFYRKYCEDSGQLKDDYLELIMHEIIHKEK
jgi:hypothetical protein